MLELSVPELKGRELEYLTECVTTNWVSTGGPMVDRFEKEFARYLDMPNAVSTCNGTAAIHVALDALGIGPGDEVVVPALSFIASANPVVYAGASAVFADIDPVTWGYDMTSLESMITSRTRAIMVVHLYGFPVPMEEIMDLAASRDLYVIEDASEALGSTWKGQYAGTFGHIGCFSFNGNKIMTTGAGGMVVTRDTDVKNLVYHLTTQARSDPVRYEHDMIGYNYRLSNIAAALGVAQLEQLPGFLRRKRKMGAIYRRELAALDQIDLPPHHADACPNYWLNCVLIDEENSRHSRDELVDLLEQSGIQGRPFFQPIPRQKPYHAAVSAPFPAAADLAGRGLCLPSAVKHTDDQIEEVCDVLGALVKGPCHG